MNELQDLFQTRTIRARAKHFLASAREGHSTHFWIADEKMGACAELVAQIPKERYPDLDIPFHSRWRHFEAGGVDRRPWLNEEANNPIALIDLVIVSVLLDAGAGAQWKYLEKETGQTFTRSEGLGVASFNAFMSGEFSSQDGSKLQCDAKALKSVTADQLAKIFQVSPTNPLVGLDGRADLLRRLGHALEMHPEIFGKDARPGQLFEHASKRWTHVSAHQLLSLILETLSSIWPSGQALQGVALGDCWPHPFLGTSRALPSGWMPFHKLSQWLTYSLLEPFMWSGVPVIGLHELTGLPEYRNGGLFLDSGVIAFKNESTQMAWHQPSDELIVEWRALTVALLDELAPVVRDLLHRSEEQMPLACVLEGGTWAAGRSLASKLRGGAPPILIQSDGTVF